MYLLPKDLVQMLLHTLQFHRHSQLGGDCSAHQRSYSKSVLQGKEVNIARDVLSIHGKSALLSYRQESGSLGKVHPRP